ncbi:MAG: stage III sporulation protein E [Planctomycetes bacterium RBG_16_64_12]|nr:MAG: stage III sporulation protein E [Planctomycetes bacterium RBG_16_64_12]
MLEKRDLKVDLLALGLLALTVFLAASLLSYDRADPPAKLVYPQHTGPTNVCGPYGALASTWMLEALGLGAYYLVASLAVLDSLLLARRPIGQPLLRSVGWLLSLAGFSTLAAMAVPQWSPGPVIGSGGYLGAATHGLLEMNFASVGAYILVVSVILGGLLLSTDYVLLRILARTLGIPIKGLGHGVLRVGTAYAEKLNAKPPGTADFSEKEGQTGDSTPSVRIGGRLAAQEGKDGPKGEEDKKDLSLGGGDQPPEGESDRRLRPPATSPLRIHKPKKSQREEVLEQIEAANTSDDALDYELPSLDLLLESEPFCFEEHEQEVRRKAEVLEKTFADFGYRVRVVEIQTGPVVAQFEVELEAGLRLSRITGLADDLAIALRVPSVRIVAPLPGKNTVGLEVPNGQRQLVRLREVMEEADGTVQAMRIPVYLGKDVAGNAIVVDLASLPHLLIAGRTGTGKSVCLNSIIASILMCRRPDEVRLLLVDPKMVELSPYKNIPHLMHPVVTDMRKAEAILAWAVEKMEERYQLLARAGVRHLAVYNQLGREELMERIQPSEEERPHIPTRMPFIVLVADEMADLMMTAAKEVESHIIRLAQKSRAVGIHLVLATQKPTVDVITGLIKSNLPARICFEVSSRTDSRVVLDEMGADKLLGNGDLLFLRPGSSTLLRGQGTYLSDDEIARVIDAVATGEPQFVEELIQLKAADSEPETCQLTNRDELYEPAIDLVVREGRGSVSLLQRALGIGYGRAARLIDYMAEDGIVGPYNGSQAREVLMTVDDWEQMHGHLPEEKPAASPPRRTNKILLDSPAGSEPLKDRTAGFVPSRLSTVHEPVEHTTRGPNEQDAEYFGEAEDIFPDQTGEKDGFDAEDAHDERDLDEDDFEDEEEDKYDDEDDFDDEGYNKEYDP